MKDLIRHILKEELEGQEFIDNFNKEKQRFERTKDEIIGYISSQYPNLVDVEYRTKKVRLASIKLENPTIERVQVTLKFKNLTNNEITRSKDLKNDIFNMFTNYFGFDVLEYGSPIELEFKAQAWIKF